MKIEYSLDLATVEEILVATVDITSTVNILDINNCKIIYLGWLGGRGFNYLHSVVYCAVVITAQPRLGQKQLQL